MPIIEVNHLIKKFEDLIAVDNISFSVEKGEVFGLLGPNGAGKTTTMEIIEGLQKPNSGQTFVKGTDTHKELNKVKEIIGIQLQASAYYDHLTLKEILKLFGSFYKKLLQPEKLLKIVGLEDKSKSLVRKLSGGQKQRFSICASLVNDPEIVFLDEPTTGLDPQARRLMWEFIKKINKEGRTIMLTTHYMEEAQFLCHRVGIMDKGKIIALDAPMNLVNNLKSSARINFKSTKEINTEEIKSISGVLSVEKINHNSFHLNVTKGNEVLPKLYKWAEKNNVFMENLEVLSATLEDVFLELTGKELKE